MGRSTKDKADKAEQGDLAHTSTDRRMTVYNQNLGRPRWVLHMQAVMWRFLMGLGMFFHKLALPRPPKPNFFRNIPSTISGRAGNIGLNFYVPIDYEVQRLLWINRPEMDLEREESSENSLEQDKGKNRRISIASIGNVGDMIRRRSTSARKWGGYPCVINFHGGGFTLGTARDDARWCGTVVDECHAVVVSVDYRLAPENPFPTAVEDGVDAVLYIYNHADELGIDTDKIALSGFSSGGNMAFSVPFRLYDEVKGFPRDKVTRPPTRRQQTERAYYGRAMETSAEGAPLSPTATNSPSALSPSAPSPSGPSSSKDNLLSAKTAPTASSSNPDLLAPEEFEYTPTPLPAHDRNDMFENIKQTSHPSVSIRMIVPWYPPVDYTRTRDQRRATGRRPDQELPALFTDLFDESYLHPPRSIGLDSPYLSPGVAPASLLKNALPDEIILHTCEWDMLLDEGQAFYERLISPEIGKKVWYKMIEGVPHGWDKAPNPWKPTPGVREHYLRACKEMRRVFGAEKGQRPPIERGTTKGYPTVAPEGTKAIVR